MKTLDEVIKALAICKNTDINRSCKDCPMPDDQWCINYLMEDALHYLKAFRDAKNALDAEREKTIDAYCQWKDAKEKLEAQTSQKMWVDKHFQFEISDNPPLTWDELKQMKGKPVWVEAGKFGSHWYLIEEICPNETIVCLGKFHESITLYHEDILTYWQAYRKERS